MGQPGRPPKALIATQAHFCDLLRKGLARKHAAAQMNLTEETISDWYARGARDPKGTFRNFHLGVNRAEADFAQTVLDMLMSGAAKDPKIAQWLLSRRFPELYGRKDNVEDERPEDRAAQQQATRSLLMERLERMLPDPTPAPAEAPAALPATVEPAPESADAHG